VLRIYILIQHTGWRLQNCGNHSYAFIEVFFAGAICHLQRVDVPVTCNDQERWWRLQIVFNRSAAAHKMLHHRRRVGVSELTELRLSVAKDGWVAHIGNLKSHLIEKRLKGEELRRLKSHNVTAF